MHPHPSFVEAMSSSQWSLVNDENCYSPYVKSRPWYEENFTDGSDVLTRATMAYSTSFFLPDIYEDDEFENDNIEIYSNEDVASKTRMTWLAVFVNIRLFVQGVLSGSSKHKTSTASLH